MDEQARRHLLTIGLEDYYQVGTFNRLIQRGQWYRFETRVTESTEKTLALLDEYGIRATFFVLGWIGDTLPELVREVANRGHEIASKGYYHRNIRHMTPGEFREDLARAREALQNASGQRVLGYRMADGWFGPQDLWALDVLAEEGYDYDSSIAPTFRNFAAEPWRRFAHLHHVGERLLWEFPISTHELLGMSVPIAGGNYLRQFPASLVRRAVAQWDRTYTAPLVMYFHTWEMDAEQPKIDAVSWLSKVRQYRNLDRMPELLSYYFERYRFTGVADHLGLATALPRPRLAAGELTAIGLPATPVLLPAPAAAPAPSDRIPVSVVVPCFNEELILPYLSNTLKSVEQQLDQYEFRFILVDDRSTDGTWEAMQRVFGNRPNFQLVRHERNQGVATGIMTGIRQADTEIVCSIDCDCTYDPHELGRMIPLLTPDVSMVTASPYHPDGGVRNVAGWRLFLSRGASSLYRLVLHNHLETYTSCFRVYRRSALAPLRLTRSGFLGVTEMIGRIDLAGHKVVEFPTVLEVRILGRSKMKVVKTIWGHLKMITQFAFKRWFGPAPTPPAPVPDAPAARSSETIRV